MESKFLNVMDGLMGEINGKPCFYYNGYMVGHEEYELIIIMDPEHTKNPETVLRIYGSAVQNVFDKKRVNRISITLKMGDYLLADCLQKLNFRESIDPKKIVPNCKTFYLYRNNFSFGI